MDYIMIFSYPYRFHRRINRRCTPFLDSLYTFKYLWFLLKFLLPLCFSIVSISKLFTFLFVFYLFFFFLDIFYTSSFVLLYLLMVIVLPLTIILFVFCAK